MKLSDKISKRVYTPRKINIWTSLGFGINDFVGGGGMTIMGAWLLFFFTTYCGLSATQGGLIMGIARVLDAILSLFAGAVTDNFYKTKLGKKFGRRHFWLTFGAPFLLIFATIWIPSMNFWYYLVIYVAYDLLSSLLLIPWETLPTEMTKDFDERTKLSSTRMFISAGGTFLATFIPGQLFKILGQDSPVPFFINGLIFAIIFVTGMFISSFSTWEKPVSEVEREAAQAAEGKEKVTGLWAKTKNIFGGYGDALKIKAFRQHLCIYLFSFTGKDVYNTVFTYFIVFCLGATATLSANLMSLSIIGVVIPLIAGPAMIKFGPKFLYNVSYITMIVMLAGYYFLFKNNIAIVGGMVILIYVMSFIYQAARATLEFTPWNVFPFIPDLDEIVTTESHSGAFASLMNFARKSTVAISTIIVGMILDSNGFVKNNLHQTVQAQNTIANILLFGAGGLILIALIISWKFDLNKQSHKVVTDEIARLRAGGSKADATELTKKTVEDLTGTPYKKVWNKK
ncbi:MAG TPA: MFS transporter [Ligilactobacillus acidipiscis]|uniref:MFS transporter n=1 Tax=Ligilactobacillus acidipiscis TaxID=89059 RepID=A0A921K199_9LACO|nr:MFS transporter [Ligilactobacillus acidipiscis]